MPAGSNYPILSSQADYDTTAIKHPFNYLYYACDAHCNQKVFFSTKILKMHFSFSNIILLYFYYKSCGCSFCSLLYFSLFYSLLYTDERF